ncbi:MAG TPA: hypothetical protein VEB22_12710 [Phycisphaerales bacterium]|nr:hypothetical protein [Phycisphaerales bacterium]
MGKWKPGGSSSMSDRLRDFLGDAAGGGKNWKLWGTVAALVVVGGFAIWSISNAVSDPQSGTNYIAAIDGSDPEHPVPLPRFYAPAGDKAPYKSPSTGKTAVWPAEKCYWTRDGKAKTEPTLVLLNSYVGKPGDTICPDCGKKVYPRNKPPPDDLMAEAEREGR